MTEKDEAVLSFLIFQAKDKDEFASQFGPHTIFDLETSTILYSMKQLNSPAFYVTEFGILNATMKSSGRVKSPILGHF
jgi:hypothetical protein